MVSLADGVFPIVVGSSPHDVESFLERSRCVIASSLNESTRGIKRFGVPLSEPFEAMKNEKVVFFSEVNSSSMFASPRWSHRKKIGNGLSHQYQLATRDVFPLNGHKHMA